MAKTTGTPFMGNEFTKMFDFTKFEADFGKFAQQFKMPKVDGADFLAAQQKNFEAVTAANRIAMEGMQALARRQAEIARSAAEEFGKATRELSDSKSLEDSLTRQTDMVKEAYAKALGNMRELTEMTVKSQSKATDLISARVTEGLEEIKTAITKAAAK